MAKPELKMTRECKDRFLAELSKYGNVTQAARVVNVSRPVLYKHKRDEEDFRVEWESAARIGALALEDEARRRAYEGWEDPVFHKGEQCGTVRKFSDTLLLRLLQAHHPDKYADRSKVQAEVNVSLSELVKDLDIDDVVG
jgi:hypothetical protein